MSGNHRRPDYLYHIQQAAADAHGFVEGLAKDDLLADERTRQAVIIGEAATKVLDGYAEFIQAHAEVPWRSMRNRMAHGYFDINLDVRYRNGCRRCSSNCLLCARMPTTKTAATKVGDICS